MSALPPVPKKQTTASNGNVVSSRGFADPPYENETGMTVSGGSGYVKFDKPKKEVHRSKYFKDIRKILKRG